MTQFITIPVWFLLLAFLGAPVGVLVGVLTGVSILIAYRNGKSPTQGLTDRIASAFKKTVPEEPDKKPGTVHPPAMKP